MHIFMDYIIILQFSVLHTELCFPNRILTFLLLIVLDLKHILYDTSKCAPITFSGWIKLLQSVTFILTNNGSYFNPFYKSKRGENKEGAIRALKS